MFIKRKEEPKKPKYKAIYKSLHSGNIKEFTTNEPTETPANFLQQSEDIWEVYMLVSVMPLDKAEE